MELRNITTFLRVAELQNFTHAAIELGYSQSAVTVQIRQLETELGVPLFERIGRSVRLTAPGQTFLQQAGEIIKAADRARDAVRAAPEPEGTLRFVTEGEGFLVSAGELAVAGPGQMHGGFSVSEKGC